MSHKFKKKRFMNVVFSLRKDQKSKDGEAIIYWYLSYNGQKSKRLSSGIKIHEKYWQSKFAIGVNAKPINDALENLKADLTNIFNQYNEDISHIQEIATIYNKGFDRITVLELYDLLLERKKSENWKLGTIKVYKSFRNVWLVPFCKSVGTPFYADTFRPKHLEMRLHHLTFLG